MKLKHYLLASEENDYRPFITSPMAMVFFLVIIWGLRFLLPITVTFAQSYLDPRDIENRINAERSARNIPTLTTNDKLITAAASKANDMLARSYFSHIDPDGNYVWPKITAAGYTPYLTLGENLAMDFTSASDMVTAWMNSPTHRANLLNENFQDQGVASASGRYDNDHDTTIVVSLFGKLGKTAAATQTNFNPSSNQLAIGPDVQISVTQVSGHSLVDINLPISGSPTLVTAKLSGQSITLLSQGAGRYAGTFTFNLSESLNGQQISVEARNASGSKITGSYPIANVEAIPSDNSASQTAGSPSVRLPKIPVSQEAEIIRLLRIIFGVLSVVYLGFLVTDWIIIRRARVERPGLHLAPQIVVFMIVAFVNLFVKF